MNRKFMTQEEKQILLQDLSARLQYGVKISKANVIYPMTGINIALGYMELAVSEIVLIEDARPYLRPMSSMSEKEKEELRDKNILIAISTSGKIETTIDGFDWLNKNMFDYRGLIPMDLALEAPEGMYNFK